MSTSKDLHEAAKRGDVDRLRAVLAGGVAIDSRDEKGWTALMWAAYNLHSDAVDLLLASGADPGVRDRLVQDAADVALHSPQEGDRVSLAIRIKHHPAYVHRTAELAEQARRLAEALQNRVRGRIVAGGQLDCHADWCIATRYRGMSCLLWVFASGTNLWVQNYRGANASIFYQVENEDKVGVVRSDELRSLARKLDEFWSEDFPVYHWPDWGKIKESEAFVRANEGDLRELRLEQYEWLAITSGQIRLRSLTTDVDITVERLNHLAAIFGRSSRPLPKPLIKKAARIRLRKDMQSNERVRFVHELWGDPTFPLSCPQCREAMHRIAVIDTRDPVLEPVGWPWPQLELLGCLRCSIFAGPSFYHYKEGGVEVLAQIDAGFADEVDALDSIPFDLIVPSRPPSGKVSKVGGRASWVQTDDTPDCPLCKTLMPFLLQLASTDGFSFGDEGVLYAFVCAPCRVTATLVQSH